MIDEKELAKENWIYRVKKVNSIGVYQCLKCKDIFSCDDKETVYCRFCEERKYEKLQNTITLPSTI